MLEVTPECFATFECVDAREVPGIVCLALLSRLLRVQRQVGTMCRLCHSCAVMGRGLGTASDAPSQQCCAWQRGSLACICPEIRRVVMLRDHYRIVIQTSTASQLSNKHRNRRTDCGSTAHCALRTAQCANRNQYSGNQLGQLFVWQAVPSPNPTYLILI